MIGKKKSASSQDTIDNGSEVEYLVGQKWRKGIVHAVRRVDEKGVPKVTAYLVDTGKTHLEGEIVTDEGEDNIPYSQPIQAEVLPENIRLVS